MIWDPRHLVIRIENTGREEFIPDDFEAPVRFDIADSVKVVRIGSRSNRSITAMPQSPVTAGIPIGFRPLMLKPGEWFDLEAFAEIDERASRAITVTGRVRHIDKLRLSDSSLSTDWLPGLKYTGESREWGLRPRIPLAYAGLLVIALVAVIGIAAFSPTP